MATYSTEEIQGLNDGILEFEELVKMWAKTMMTTSTYSGFQQQSGQYDYDISWTKVEIKHGTPDFHDAGNTPSPKSQVLFNSTYTNNSESEQVNNFRAQRSTTSIAELTVTEGVCLPVAAVKVPLPPSVASANAGFPAELSVCKMDRKSWEETLAWSVDTQITVGAGKTTKAKMVVEEKQWSGDFSIVTTVSGKVKVAVRNAVTRELVRSIIGSVKEICTPALQNGLNVASIHLTSSGIQFVNNGHLNFRYGVEQNVNISENRDY